MLVTDTQDHITHAVIGGEQTMDFGISNNAEFFQILSSSLYTNQIMAVVREVMCNAWDAHIEAGITDKPISVSLIGGELIIRDYGTGIPKSNIHQVYAIYGQSTKRLKGNVTGGFGLGCKAPFAYQDHFEVTSWNQEEMTIYAMCRSSSEANGKPGVTPIVSLPTTETGLQVKVAVKQNDINVFRKYITEVASNGEMLVSYTGEFNLTAPSILPVIPFSQSKLGFVIHKTGIGTGTSVILLRYGNVIYPVPTHDFFAKEYLESTLALKRMPIDHSCPTLILMAPANSICVAPSREALSMQQKTVETVKQLLIDFLAKVNSKLVIQKIKEVRSKIFQQMIDSKLLSADDFISNELFTKRKQTASYFMDYEALGDLVVGSTRFDLPPSMAKQMVRVVPQEQKGAAQTFVDYIGDNSSKERWHFREVVVKLTAFCKRIAPTNTKAPLFFRAGRYNSMEEKHSKAFFHHTTLSLLFKKTFVLTCSVSTVRSRLADWPTSFGNDIMVVQPIARTDPNLDKLREALNNRKDINFIDLTIKHEWEIVEKDRTVKTKPKGIVLIKKILEGYKPKDGIDSLDEDDFITDPVFVIHFPRGDDVMNTPFSRPMERQILTRFGHLGGICTTTPSYHSYLGKGAVSLVTYLTELTHAYLIKNKKVRRYLSIAASANNDGNALVEAILRNMELTKHFGLYTAMSDDDMFYLELYRALRNMEKIKEVTAFFEKAKPNPFFKIVADVFKEDILFKYMDARSFSRLLTSTHESALVEKHGAIAIIKAKFKG